MDLQTQALNACELRVKEALPILERWVTQNSYSADIDAVNACGRLLANDFELPGLVLKILPGKDVGDHLFFTTDAWQNAKPEDRTLLVGHHDTVFPPGTFDIWEINDDILRGPGVLDMKGGLVTIRTALAALADVSVLADLPLALMCVGDEEIGSPHSSDLLQEVARGVGRGLVFEAGRAEDAIITRRKGTAGIKIVCKGVAAHAGNHHKEGRNAIWALAKFIDRVQQLTDYDSGITINVGLVDGGEARNTVPPLASCQVDMRFIDKESGEKTVDKIKAIAKDLSLDGITCDVEGGIKRLPLERSPQSLALCKAYGDAASAEGLGAKEANLIGGGSDASTVSAIGVPAIDGLGPRGSGFHTKKEIIEISSLSMRARALVRFLCGLRIQ